MKECNSEPSFNLSCDLPEDVKLPTVVMLMMAMTGIPAVSPPSSGDVLEFIPCFVFLLV